MVFQNENKWILKSKFCFLEKRSNLHQSVKSRIKDYFPADIYLFKVNYGITKTMCEIFSKLTIKTPERRH